MFDDIAIYNKALTKAEIDNIIAYKNYRLQRISTTLKRCRQCHNLRCRNYRTSWRRMGNVFQNVGGALRSNYLVLPEDALSHTADTKQLTVAVWVNSENAGLLLITCGLRCSWHTVQDQPLIMVHRCWHANTGGTAS